MVMKTDLISKKVLLFILVVALVIFTTGVAAQEDENVRVVVNAPEFVSGTFDVTIDIYDVIDLASGNFKLYFDPDVVNMIDVESVGNIGGTEFGILGSAVGDKVIVTFKVRDTGRVSGSGYLATISFEVVGHDGDTSALEVSDKGLFGYIDPANPVLSGNPAENEINANWSDDVVTVGDTGTVETGKTASTPVRTATPRPSPSSLDSGAEPATTPTPSTEHGSDAAVPVEASENGGPDWWDVFVEHNFIGTYLFIGLLAFTYTLILLR
ncbi:MAG: hypothetical protein EF813_02805 [Methanosarcinales archaeon]|nr:MAG: hypothetical protein EF813_02805 [Methanosarcinales archaeon]